jgi:LuxR family maltose regulon positive regulatory protein
LELRSPGPTIIPPSAVWRARLIGGLNAAAEANRLTVLSAPAGFGKSVLLAQWVASRPALPVAWFSLSGPDNDATTLLDQLAALPEITLVIDDVDVLNAAVTARLA